MAKQRVLIIETQALVPGSRTYAVWNALDKSANITLASGNLSASRSTAGGWQGVRATMGLSSGQHYWETTHTHSAGTTDYSAGVANGVHSFASQLGFSSTASAGGPVQDGRVAFNGAYGTDAGTVSTGNKVRHWLNMDGGFYRIAIQGGAWVTVATGLTGTFYPAAGFSTTSRTILANFGASAFTYEVPAGARAGVYTEGASTAQPLYLASESFVVDYDSTTASRQNRRFVGRMAPQFDPILSRSVSFWPWGRASNARSGLGDIELINDDFALDEWREWNFRDQPITVYYADDIDAAKAWSSGSPPATWWTGRVDRLELRERRAVLVLADILAAFEKPLQTTLYAEDQANEQLAGKPLPVCFGHALNVEPLRLDTTTTERHYEIADGAIQEISAITDKADPLVVTTDWSYRQDSRQFTLVNTPDGRVAAEVKGALKLGTALIDGSNGGDFTTWALGVPVGWTEASSGDGVNDVIQSGATANFRSNGGGTASLAKSSITTLGALYWCELQVTAYSSGSLEVRGTTPYRSGINATGTYRFAFTANSTSFTIRIPALSAGNITIDNVRLYPATLIEQFDDVIEYLAVTRGTLTSADLDTATLAALADDYPYAMAYYATQPTQLRSVLREVEQSLGGCLYLNRLGKLSAVRMQDPDTTPVLTITDAERAGEPTLLADLAPGLTTIVGAKRNWSLHSDSDFVSTATETTRQRLKARYQAIRKALGVVHPMYAHADSAAPLDTLLQAPADAKALISAFATLYSQPRWVGGVPCYLDQTTADTLEPGQTIQLRFPRFDWALGKNVRVTSVQQRARSQLVDVGFWY